MTEPTPDTPESELTTGDPARDFVYWFVEQPHHRQQAFVIDWLARHPEVVRDTRWPFAALPNREAAPREGLDGSEEESIRALVEWPGPNWSDPNSTVLLDYLRHVLAALDAARGEAAPREGLDVERLARALLSRGWSSSGKWLHVHRDDAATFANHVAAEYDRLGR